MVLFYFLQPHNLSALFIRDLTFSLTRGSGGKAARGCGRHGRACPYGFKRGCGLRLGDQGCACATGCARSDSLRSLSCGLAGALDPALPCALREPAASPRPMKTDSRKGRVRLAWGAGDVAARAAPV